MKNFKWYTLGAVVIAGIWGYFSDLSKGNFYGFIAKIFFIFAFMMATYFSMARARKKADKAKETIEISNKEKNNKKQNNKKSSKK
ncbi:hypothetical protein GCM10008905_20740 [Clostridium malenominatum]|uniref:Uncharacterized protein n=1 Tax=Clostridium malenominatum TaxID=1539 RepID=A0ABN1J0U4_9CLOT